MAASAKFQQVVVIELSGCAQLMTPSIVNGICGALGSLGVGAAGAAVGTDGVFTGAGAGSPRQVVVIALSGCAQLMTPSIVIGIPSAEAEVGVTKVIKSEVSEIAKIAAFNLDFMEKAYMWRICSATSSFG